MFLIVLDCMIWLLIKIITAVTDNKCLFEYCNESAVEKEEENWNLLCENYFMWKIKSKRGRKYAWYLVIDNLSNYCKVICLNKFMNFDLLNELAKYHKTR